MRQLILVGGVASCPLRLQLSGYWPRRTAWESILCSVSRLLADTITYPPGHSSPGSPESSGNSQSVLNKPLPRRAMPWQQNDGDLLYAYLESINHRRRKEIAMVPAAKLSTFGTIVGLVEHGIGMPLA